MSIIEETGDRICHRPRFRARRTATVGLDLAASAASACHTLRVTPPSTRMIAPVVKLDAALARCTARGATSSG